MCLQVLYVTKTNAKFFWIIMFSTQAFNDYRRDVTKQYKPNHITQLKNIQGSKRQWIEK